MLGVVADSCAEIPTPRIVTYNIMRLRRVGYLPKFDGYLRQLSFTKEERATVTSAGDTELLNLVQSVADRERWGAEPDAHLAATGCSLATVASDSAESTIGIAPLDPVYLLDLYASLMSDVRLFLGIDPGRPSTLAQALELQDHPAFAGVAVMPYLAEVPLSDPAYAPVLSAAASGGVRVWAHTASHFRLDVAYDISHPRHVDTVLMRYPDLRLLIGHAGWPWVADACAVASRFPRVAIEFSTFPPGVLADPGWSLTPLLARRKEFRGRVFFGSGAVSAIDPFMARLQQLEDLPLGDQHDDWRGAGFLRWMSDTTD
jgi:predicted TIM-barrel fold metal-dependent hydrolase